MREYGFKKHYAILLDDHHSDEFYQIGGRFRYRKNALKKAEQLSEYHKTYVYNITTRSEIAYFKMTRYI